MDKTSVPVVVFWFRRDLRLHDNAGLNSALKSGLPVLPLFIFDKTITDELEKDDPRISFIYDSLAKINKALRKTGSSLLLMQGTPISSFVELTSRYQVKRVYFNRDYEPYAIQRDHEIKYYLTGKGIDVYNYKDQVIFEQNDVIKNDGTPYTIYTPYKNKWLQKFISQKPVLIQDLDEDQFFNHNEPLPDLNFLGFRRSGIKVVNYNFSVLPTYEETRNLPAEDSTTYLSPHLRFGTVSIRQILNYLGNQYEIFRNELIWREFFMQILFHFPWTVIRNFRSKYDGIKWRNNEDEFSKWCEGETGYPMVDSGMRQLNLTGYMHNRMRMITASFLCKHLLIDWRWGEAYFAKKLLDYELSSNIGNWQWAAGTGCDAAPYFRIFNPLEQQRKYDKNYQYIKKWIPEFGTNKYPDPIIQHSFARKRALEVYKKGIEK